MSMSYVRSDKCLFAFRSFAIVQTNQLQLCTNLKNPTIGSSRIETCYHPTPDSGFEALVHAVDLDPMVLDAASSVGAMPPAIQGLQASLGWKTSPDIPCEAIVKWLLLISFRISREGGSLVSFFSYIWIHLILLWLKLECRLTLPR